MQSSKQSKKISETSDSAATIASEPAAKPRATKSSSTSKSKPATSHSEKPVRKSTVKSRISAGAPHSEVSKPVVTQVSYDEISKLAYSLWASRGYRAGSPEQDWLRAEQHLKSLAAAN